MYSNKMNKWRNERKKEDQLREKKASRRKRSEHTEEFESKRVTNTSGSKKKKIKGTSGCYGKLKSKEEIKGEMSMKLY